MPDNQEQITELIPVEETTTEIEIPEYNEEILMNLQSINQYTQYNFHMNFMLFCGLSVFAIGWFFYKAISNTIGNKF